MCYGVKVGNQLNVRTAKGNYIALSLWAKQ
ncbi:hypothetical protein FHS16_001759 [Paenibacillus endophyticus]|uniref:Uncharacterized protein n=1 Tax=Paenibacillus endophyticus TaxID=1294268 RepID=A0A7W5C5T7_9BACL|nr:hypothetical protein [Paenibacillus endophyticus]